MTPRGHHQQTRAAYDVVADDYAALLPGLDAETPLDVAMLDDFARRCGDAPRGLVADVGCGTGRVTAHLAAAGLGVVGVDLSVGMVAAARRSQPEVRFAVAALEALPFAEASLGGLLAWYSLIHTPPSQLGSVAAELARVTAPGGWLLTAFQAGSGERVDRSSAYGHPVELTNFRHDPADVVAALEVNGFCVEVRLHRSPEGRETQPQAMVLARRT